MGKKREGMQRMLVIINKLKGPQQYVPRKELENYVTHRMEERDGTPVDIRTLQRDFKDIEDLFGIRICFDKKQNGYYINEEDDLKKRAVRTASAKLRPIEFFGQYFQPTHLCSRRTPSSKRQ